MVLESMKAATLISESDGKPRPQDLPLDLRAPKVRRGRRDPTEEDVQCARNFSVPSKLACCSIQ